MVTTGRLDGRGKKGITSKYVYVKACKVQKGQLADAWWRGGGEGAFRGGSFLGSLGGGVLDKKGPLLRKKRRKSAKGSSIRSWQLALKSIRKEKAVRGGWHEGES